jgi:protoporphyrin/coproporphyrin ferrochelatase
MRYWQPRADEAARAVRAFAPDEVVLLPLYPQYSGATSGSSLRDWREAARAVGLEAPTRAVCCWPAAQEFVEAQADLLLPLLAEAARAGRPKLLFSAHGLPKRTVARGDPYQWQTERTAQALAAELTRRQGSAPDWTLCYQSRVGPLEWIGPATDAEIARAAKDGRPVVVAPIAFVSEHSETLVAVGVNDGFIRGLARLVAEAGKPIGSAEGGRICPAAHRRCPLPA